MASPTNKTILLAGFEPFGGFDVNPSQLIVEALDGETIDGYSVKGLVLPVVFGDAGDKLLAAMESETPGAVVCLGLAADRQEITLERLAVNLDDARIPDNAGNKPVDKVIVPGAPAACWTTLPVRKMLSDLQARNIPSSLSMSAGTYVCNHVFFRILHTFREKPGTIGGFVHLPPVTGRIEDELPALTLVVKSLLASVVDEISQQPAPS